MSDLEAIRQALCDPDAPWYGSDLVPLVADACDEIENLQRMLSQTSELLIAKCQEMDRVSKRIDEIYNVARAVSGKS